MIAAAGLAAAHLRRQRVAQGLSVAALISALASATLMGQTAHLGGQIRHDEIRRQVHDGTAQHGDDLTGRPRRGDD